MLRPALLIVLHSLLAACNEPRVIKDPFENLEIADGTRVDLQGVKLHYRDVGNGTPVMLLHGAGLDSRMWIAQIATLSDHYRVVAVDLPGFGQSPTPRGPYSHAVTLAHLLDALRIQRAHVVGISDGAEDVLDFSYRFPGSAITLTLVSPRLGGQQWSCEALASFEPIMSAAAQGNSRKAAGAWLQHPLFASAMSNPYLAEHVRTIHLDNSGMWARGTFPQRPEPPTIERLREIDVPALIIVGDRDMESVYEIARTIDRQAVDSRLEVVPRAGHLVNMETPAAFNRLVREFLVEHPATRASEN